MRRGLLSVLLVAGALLVIGSTTPVLAQEEPPAGDAPGLTIYTEYPAQIIGVGERASLDLSLQTETTAQVVYLEVEGLPEGWTATFRGGGEVIRAVYVRPGDNASVNLRIETAENAEPGNYRLTVVARGETATAELPVELTIQERVPASLSLDVDLPTLRGKPDTTFRYSVSLKNEGDEDLTVELFAEAPPAFDVTFRSAGQEVTSLPLKANETKRLSIEVDPILNLIPAGSYTITIRAQGGEAVVSTELVAEVVGQSSLTLTTPDERFSGQAEAGSETAFTLLVQNTGSAAARAIEMSASAPRGWTVEFDPKEIDELAPGDQVEVTATVKPASKALAGDYIVSFTARPEDGAAETVEYRVTVRTSTLWGVVGVALIAVAVGVVGLAVMRFGRR
ncbi:MAG TPA: hypothetical protein ENI95_14060 [Chloroflexi bacterium]|nr:hypothetical protein [Chloroflexota bacterium]